MRKLFRNITSYLAVLFACLSSHGFGQVEPTPTINPVDLKRYVISNCDLALSQSKSLSDDARIEFIKFLRLVVTMPTGKVSSLHSELPFQAAGGLGTISGPLTDKLDIWRTFDPNREAEAKRCAVEILGTYGSYSKEALPDILTLSQDRGLPFEIYDFIDDTVLKISLGVSDTGDNDPEFLRNIAGFLSRDSLVLARNIESELWRVSIPVLVDELKKPDLSKRDSIFRTLLFIDNEGDKVAPYIINLLNVSDDSLRRSIVKFLGMFDGHKSQALPALLERLSDPSVDVQKESLVSINKYFEQESVFNDPSPEVANHIFDLFEKRPASDRDVLVKGVRKFWGVINPSEKLVNHIGGKDFDLASRSINLLSEHGELKETIFKAVVNAGKTKNKLVRGASIEALSKEKSRKGEVLNFFAHILKSSKNNSGLYEFTSNQILKNLGKLGASINGPILSALILEGLKSEDSETRQASINLLAGKGNSVLSLVTKLLSAEDPLSRLGALEVYNQISTPGKKKTSTIVEKLKDSNDAVWNRSIEIIISNKGDYLEATKRLLKEKDSSIRARAAYVLASCGVSDTSVISLLFESINNASCKDRQSYISVLKQAMGSLPGQITDSFVDCLYKSPRFSLDALSTLKSVSPLAESTLDLIMSRNREQHLDMAGKLKVVESLVELGASSDDSVIALKHFINNSESTLKRRAVRALPRFGNAARSALQDLKALRENSATDPLLLFEVGLAMVQIDPNSLDIDAFVAETVKNEGLPWIKEVSDQLNDDFLQTLLGACLNRPEEESKILALHLLGNMGEKATPSLTRISEVLRTTKVPNVRYEATVSLLKVEPSDSLSYEGAVWLLGGRMGLRVLDEQFRPNIIPLLEKVRDESRSFVIRQGSDMIIKTSKRNS